MASDSRKNNFQKKKFSGNLPVSGWMDGKSKQKANDF